MGLVLASCGNCGGGGRTASQLAFAAYDPSTYWSSNFATAGSAVGIVVLDGSFATAGANSKTTNWINSMEVQKQMVFGYVAVMHGSVDPPLIMNKEVTNLHMWYPQLTGIYLDEGPIDDGNQVQSNNQTTRQNYATYAAGIHNYGWKVMIEAGGYPFEWVMTVADYVLIWEGAPSLYETTETGYRPCTGSPCSPNPLYPTAPNWWNNRSKIVHTIYGYTPGSGNYADQASVKQVLEKAWQRGAGYVYLTDASKPGPFPPYWQDEVIAAQ
jgi:hypothetical protein